MPVMRSIRLAVVAFMIALSPVALVGLAAPAASAKAAHPVAGHYSFTVHWTDPVINNTTTMDLAADGSASFGDGAIGNWTFKHKKFTMFAASATYLGKKTKTELSGTMSNTDGNSGSWSATLS
jgi:hypothetical protein